MSSPSRMAGRRLPPRSAPSHSRPKDPRQSAGLTGRHPLAYDRHGDLVPIDDPDEVAVDPAGLIGDRWLARTMVRR